MRQRLLLCCGCLLLFTTVAHAQELGGASAIGLRGGVTHYQGDDFKAALPRVYGGVHYQYYFSDRFAIEPGFSFGEFAAKTGPREFKSQLFGGSLTLQYALGGKELFRPYLLAGGEYLRYDLKTIPPSNTLPPGEDKSKDGYFTILGGAGFTVRLSNLLMLDLRGQYHYAFNDLVDASSWLRDDDHFLSATAGLTFTFRRDQDPDRDGLLTKDERRYGTDPNNPDTDGDGLKDGEEMLIYKTNPLRADTDGDGLTDGEEVLKYKTDPRNPDTDGDGLSDGDEVKKHGTDPLQKDTDKDGLDDYAEIMKYGTDPLKVDTDGDGVHDGDEVLLYKTDPLKRDTDGDGLDDFEEIFEYKTDPLNPDTDGDGLSDGDEVKIHRTDPLKADTDGGSVDDGIEVRRGTNPLDPSDDVAGLDVSRGRVVLEGITFDINSAQLRPASMGILDRAFFTLKDSPDLRVEIHGYTDNTGNIMLNMRLSQRRAEAVRDYLIARGIEAHRIRALGYGPRNPIASNATAAGRAQNRRIEFVVVQ